MAAEQCAADGLVALSLDARRTHVHYTHVRTDNPADVQPSALTREQFWRHLVTCYQEAYPDATSDTGSILQFGVVVKEKHRLAPHARDREDHHHAPTFSTAKHYWRRVRKVSAEKYHIQLNAVAHECYTTMFRYVRQATAKKPIHELDVTPYYSPGHPQGDALKALLEVGEKYRVARAAKGPSEPHQAPLRSQFGTVYNWVIDKQLKDKRGATQLQADAVQELKAGRPRLLDFVKKHKSNLEDEVAFCWELHGASQRLERQEKSRVELLYTAATCAGSTCANAGRQCKDIYEEILSYQGVDSILFRHRVYDALLYGRRKGNAVMIVGGKDTGKTTVTEPAAKIFHCMVTPQSDSFCPLQDIRGHEVFLWQDFRYCPGHPRKDEQGLRLDEGTWNRFLEGLPTRIGVAKTDGARTDFVYKEDAACIFTGPYKMIAYRNGVPDPKETEQLDVRVQYVEFHRPAPPHRDRTLQPCGRCWSKWILEGELAWERAHNVELSDIMSKVATMVTGGANVHAPLPPLPTLTHALPVSTASHLPPAAVPGDTTFMNNLSALVRWRAKGVLSEDEFAAAKRQLGI